MEARQIGTAERHELARRLIPLFLVKWPGHPGCDDAAMQLMNFAIERKDSKEIFIWAQRASLLPDGIGPGPVGGQLGHRLLIEGHLRRAARWLLEDGPLVAEDATAPPAHS